MSLSFCSKILIFDFLSWIVHKWGQFRMDNLRVQAKKKNIYIKNGSNSVFKDAD